MEALHPLRFDPVEVLARIPPEFVSDGCSGAPDSLCGKDLRPFCRAHDAAGCTRLWPPGTLTQAWRHAADRQLGREIRVELPLGIKWVGWVYWLAVHRFGGDSSFDSCGAEAGDLCRHGIATPEWMR